MIAIEWKFPKWEKRFRRAEEEINLFVAAIMQTNRGMLFDKEGSYNGHAAWAPLKFREGMILSDRGILRKSIAPFNSKGKPGPSGIVRFSGDTITIGTTLGYARMMNDGTTKMPGGVLRAKNARALKIPVPAGQSAGPAAKEIHKETNDQKILNLQRRLAAMTETNPNRAKVITQIANLRERSRKSSSSTKFIFRKSVRIPARPFDKWNAQDQREMEIALTNKIKEVLFGRTG